VAAFSGGNGRFVGLWGIGAYQMRRGKNLVHEAEWTRETNYARGTEPGQIVKLELVTRVCWGKRDWHSLLIAIAWSLRILISRQKV